VSKGEGNPNASGVDLGSGDLFSTLESMEAASAATVSAEPAPAAEVASPNVEANVDANAKADAEAEPKEGKKAKKAKKEKKKKEPKQPSADSGPGFLARMSQASPYTVMLTVAAGCLVAGIAILVVELASYGFQFK
jgi:hypothetical protein